MIDYVYRPTSTAGQTQPQPADGDDYTYPKTQDGTLNMAEIAKAIMQLKRQDERLQDELHGLAAQVVALREQLKAWEGDS